MIGVVFISQHWSVVFCGLTGSILFYRDILNEEQNNLQKFGDDYRRYMKRVPRRNLFLGIVRILTRRS